jgi:hypothetical protein
MLMEMTACINVEEEIEVAEQTKTAPTPVPVDLSDTSSRDFDPPMQITSNGMGFSIESDGDQTEFTLLLKGRQALNIWPQFSLNISGQEVYRATIDRDDWTTVTVIYPPPPGIHEVILKFVNDYYDPTKGEDRNLILKWLQIKRSEDTQQGDEGTSTTLLFPVNK